MVGSLRSRFDRSLETFNEDQEPQHLSCVTGRAAPQGPDEDRKTLPGVAQGPASIEGLGIQWVEDLGVWGLGA